MKLKKRVKLLVLVAFIGAFGILNFQNTSITSKGKIQQSLEKAIACTLLYNEGGECIYCYCDGEDVCSLFGNYYGFGELRWCS